MNHTKLKFIIGSVAIIIIATVVFVFLLFEREQQETTAIVSPDNCLPAFRDGGGPYYEPNVPFRDKLVPEDNEGEKLIVEGYLYNEDCTRTISNAVIDIWQASEEGEYEEEYYRGKIVTDDTRYYKFETVVPLGYGEGTAYRPPHIHFKVFVDDIEIVTSQMFFEDVRGVEGFEDEYIIELENNNETWIGIHNIVLPDYQ